MLKNLDCVMRVITDVAIWRPQSPGLIKSNEEFHIIRYTSIKEDVFLLSTKFYLRMFQINANSLCLKNGYF